MESASPEGEERQRPDHERDILAPDLKGPEINVDGMAPKVQEHMAAEQAVQSQADARDRIQAMPDTAPAAAPAPTETSPWAASDKAFAQDRKDYAQEYTQGGRGPVGRLFRKVNMWFRDGEPPESSGLRK